MRGIDWPRYGAPTKRLQDLAQFFGVADQTAHRALADTYTTLRLLATRRDGATFLAQLLAGKGAKARTRATAATREVAASSLLSTPVYQPGGYTPQDTRTVTIQFGRSPSASYPAAVALAQAAPTYGEVGDAKAVIHRATYWLADLPQARELLGMVSGWKSTAILLNDQPYPPRRVMPALNCYMERLRSYRPEKYCFGQDDANEYNDNELGGRHCRLDPSAWDGLKGYGKFTTGRVFHVDKGMVLHEVSRNLEAYALCPALRMAEVLQRVSAIPDVIDPKNDPDWEYVTEWNDSGTREIKVAVRKKKRSAGGGYVNKPGSLEYVIKVEPKTVPRGAGCTTMLLTVMLGLALFLITL
jgi:hypothetical protein